MQKLDIKTYLLLIFIVLGMLFAYKWFFGGLGESKSRVKQLELENVKLKKQKDSIANIIHGLEIQFDSLKAEEKNLLADVSMLAKNTAMAEERSKKSMLELDASRKTEMEIRQKIIEFQTHPATKTEAELLNSIKNKLNAK